MENVRKHRDIKLVTTVKKKKLFGARAKLSYNNFFFPEKLLAIEMKKHRYSWINLDLSVLELSKIVMYEFSYDYVKTKYEEKAKLCYMDTGSFTVNVKTDDIYKYIAKNIETRFDTSN